MPDLIEAAQTETETLTQATQRVLRFVFFITVVCLYFTARLLRPPVFMCLKIIIILIITFFFLFVIFIFFFWKSHCQIASFCLRKCKLFFCCFVFLKLELVERLSLRLYVSAGEWVHLPSGSSGTTTATKFRLISVGIEIF